MQTPPTNAIAQRNKTRRATSPTSASAAGAGGGVDPATRYGLNTGLEDYLNLNASSAYKRPWHRLERGLRLNRLRRFIEAETTRMKLSSTDVDALTNLLHRALDRKLLNSKTAVIYDPESEEIQEIKGLVYHRAADGRIVSQLVEKKGVTVRRKRVSEAGAAAPVEKNESSIPEPSSHTS